MPISLPGNVRILFIAKSFIVVFVATKVAIDRGDEHCPEAPKSAMSARSPRQCALMDNEWWND